MLSETKHLASIMSSLATLRMTKKKSSISAALSCGGPIRTNDLWVMSPTSYHCSTPRYWTAKIRKKLRVEN